MANDLKRAAGKLGGLRKAALHGADLTAANAAQVARRIAIVDPEGVLDPQERAKRVRALTRFEMNRLAAKSAAARRARCEELGHAHRPHKPLGRKNLSGQR